VADAGSVSIIRRRSPLTERTLDSVPRDSSSRDPGPLTYDVSKRAPMGARNLAAMPRFERRKEVTVNRLLKTASLNRASREVLQPDANAAVPVKRRKHAGVC
jgi:hypothetical protein